MSRSGKKNKTEETGAVLRLTALLEITKAVTGEIGLEGLMMTLAEKAAAAIGGERGAVFLFDEDTDELWPILAYTKAQINGKLGRTDDDQVYQTKLGHQVACG